MATLFILCGLPGSGKTTFCKNYPEVVHISRDEIRFSLVKEGEPYFSKEKQVTRKFWKEINKNLSEGNSVFADQTSLTKKSRQLLMNHITVPNVKFICVEVNGNNLKMSLERNEKRVGTRAYVSPEVIHSMSRDFEEPTCDEGFDEVLRYTF